MLFKTESGESTGSRMISTTLQGSLVLGVEGTYSPGFGGIKDGVSEVRQSLGSQVACLRRKQVMLSRQEELRYFFFFLMEDDWNFKSQMIGLENITDVLFLLFVSF